MPNLRNVAEASDQDLVKSDSAEKSAQDPSEGGDVARRPKAKSSGNPVAKSGVRRRSNAVFRPLPESKDLGDVSFSESRPYFVVRDNSKYCGGFATADEAHDLAEHQTGHSVRVIRRVHELPLACQRMRF